MGPLLVQRPPSTFRPSASKRPRSRAQSITILGLPPRHIFGLFGEDHSLGSATWDIRLRDPPSVAPDVRFRPGTDSDAYKSGPPRAGPPCGILEGVRFWIATAKMWGWAGVFSGAPVQSFPWSAGFHEEYSIALVGWMLLLAWRLLLQAQGTLSKSLLCLTTAFHKLASNTVRKAWHGTFHTRPVIRRWNPTGCHPHG